MQSGDATAQLAPPTDAPKPKKFFKSRNIVPATGNLTPPTLVDPIQQNTVPKLSLKVNKTKPPSASSDEVRKTKVEKPVKPKKVKKPKEEVKLSVEKPTRVLSRARKAVNYMEDGSRSPPLSIYEAAVEAARTSVSRVTDDADHATESRVNETTTADETPADEAKNVNVHDHPPIVLRISKVSKVFRFLFLLFTQPYYEGEGEMR